MADASKAYAEAMSSTIKFFLVENDRMENELQEAKQRTKYSAGFAMPEMRKLTLAEVSTLETTMRKLYDRFVTMHKVVVHIFGSQRYSTKIIQTLRYIHNVIPHVHEWTMRYKGSLLHFPKIMKP